MQPTIGTPGTTARGKGAVPQQPRRRYSAAAASSGSPDAQYALAQLYAAGIGVRQDDSLAAQWYASAARLGLVPAQIDYAIRLFNGTGIAPAFCIRSTMGEFCVAGASP